MALAQLSDEKPAIIWCVTKTQLIPEIDYAKVIEMNLIAANELLDMYGFLEAQGFTFNPLGGIHDPWVKDLGDGIYEMAEPFAGTLRVI